MKVRVNSVEYKLAFAVSPFCVFLKLYLCTPIIYKSKKIDESPTYHI